MQSTRDEGKQEQEPVQEDKQYKKRRTQTQRTGRNSSTTRTDLIIVVHTLLYLRNSRIPTPARPTSASKTFPVSAD